MKSHNISFYPLISIPQLHLTVYAAQYRYLVGTPQGSYQTTLVRIAGNPLYDNVGREIFKL